MPKVLFVAPFVAAAAVLMGAPTDAPAQTFGAKPGAWENTITVSGLTIPPDVLAKMPPDRRAIVEQQLSADGAAGQPSVRRTCVTKETLEKGFTPNPKAVAPSRRCRRPRRRW